MIESVEKAIEILNDVEEEEVPRIDAAGYLGRHGTPEGMVALAAAMSDDDYGVRYAAGDALAHLGHDALPTLLDKLIADSNDARVRGVVEHAFKHSSSGKVRAETKDVVSAMHGPAPDISTMEAAHTLKQKLA